MVLPAVRLLTKALHPPVLLITDSPPYLAAGGLGAPTVALSLADTLTDERKVSWSGFLCLLLAFTVPLAQVSIGPAMGSSSGNQLPIVD